MKIGVVGIGNVLMGDDAVGPYVIKLLEALYGFPPEVTLVEAGTPGLDLTTIFTGMDAIIVIDNVQAEGKPGELRIYGLDALLKAAPSLQFSQHDPGLREALLTMQMGDSLPQEVVLIGVIPEVIDLALELTPPVKAAVPLMIDLVLEELSGLGVTAEKKDPPDQPDIWWER